MDQPEADFNAWVDARIGRLEFEVMPKSQRELAHAAFMEGMQSRGLAFDMQRLVELPGMKKRLQVARDAAIQHREYLQTLLGTSVEPKIALAMTIAFIQAKSLNPKIQLPPEEKEGWQ